MKTTIIFAHPWSGSFNHHLLKRLIDRYPEATVIDLYKDKFDPVMREEELALFSKGQALDPLVKSYQDILIQTEQLFIVFPIWWSGMPAILKGFFDKVMLKEFAYSESKSGILQGKLTHIKSAHVVTTSQSPTWYLRSFGGNPIGKILIKRVLKDIGLKKVTWQNQGTIATSVKTKRRAFADRISTL